MNCYLFIILFAILISTNSCETIGNYKIEPVPPGLYNVEIGEAHISNGNYEFYQYYNISDIINDQKV